MNCSKAVRMISEGLDGRLKPEERRLLNNHLQKCSSCRQAEKEYAKMLGMIRFVDIPTPGPLLKENIMAEIKTSRLPNSAEIWKRRGFQTAVITVSILLFIILAGIIFLVPQKTAPIQDYLSYSESLLLKNRSPFDETQTLLQSENIESKNLMLIFSSLEGDENIRRYIP